ncbi:MAG: carbamoyltransferase HypF [Planctomycetaceae bacterium]|nr:carbamoyltransferase HypF [Planctomycetaceae bacterium]
MTVDIPTLVAGRLTVQGDVQGVGFRPSVARLARMTGVAGTVQNSVDGVEVHLEGTHSEISDFRRRLLDSLPAQARIASVSWAPTRPLNLRSFEIVASSTNGPLSTTIPPDLATCGACFREMSEAANRRAWYAFTSCTDCGPRYSIIDEMPYDRSRTTMEPFLLCQRCRAEYRDPSDRRFHAQTNVCPDCGPSLWISPRDDQSTPVWDQVAATIREGRIVALRGLGGYQLIVDATNAEAVQRLRERKRRPAKPLAVMVRSLVEAGELAELTPVDRQALSSSTRPIVLVPARKSTSLSECIHPGFNEVGLFLPTTGLHWLLLNQAQRPLVVTSGNIEGDPLAVIPKSAESSLDNVADLWVHHNREIVHPIDDSVLRPMTGRTVTIRNGRGFAPSQLRGVSRFAEACEGSSVLAVGGHQKSAVALFNGAQAVLGPHLGDMESLAMRERFVRHIDELQGLYACQSDVVVHDLHPDYFTTRWAQSHGCRTLAVQHHHAHVVSGMVENDWLERDVLGVAFDGTGYGVDGSIWGGEFLRATVGQFERVAHLRPFRLPGGEVAIRHPWRVTASLLMDVVSEHEARQTLVALGLDESAVSSVISIAPNDRLSPVTTSAGRLFDGVAALILGISDAAFEGQLAMRLESALNPAATGRYEIALQETSPLQLDWRPMMRQLLADRSNDVSPDVMASRFHRGLATAIVKVCHQFDLPVVLSGGVFQNRWLTEQVVNELQADDREVGLHRRIPPNDGGLAAGQLVIGLAWLKSEMGVHTHVSDGGL